MKIKFLVVLAVASLTNMANSFAQKLVPEYDYDTELYGFKDPESSGDSFVISPIYKELDRDLVDDYEKTTKIIFSAKDKNEKWGLIDKNGKLLVPCQYDYLETGASFDYALVGNEKGDSGMIYGVIDKTGKVVVPLKYSAIAPYANNTLVVSEEGTPNSALIDIQGKEIVPFGKYYGIQNRQYPFSNAFAEINLADEVLVLCQNEDYKYGFIDTKGQEVVAFEYDEAKPFSNKLAMVKKDNKVGYINTLGKMIIPMLYEEGWDFEKEGYALVKKGNKWGAIDQKNKVLVGFIFDDGVVLSGNLLSGTINGKEATKEIKL